jgi:ATP-dependent Clp protease ATP-binding subunit ClpX
MIEVCSFCGEKKPVVEGLNGYICLDCCREFIGELEHSTDDVANVSTALNPSKLKQELDRYVVGQEEAKKIISVAVCNHMKRIEANNDLLEKTNILILGPTGCGKTFLMSTIAKFLKVPMVIVDATNFTQVGYVGEDVSNILKKLYMASNGDLEKCKKGIVYVDEIDKVMAKTSSHGDRDAAGTGVQQNFLKLMEGGTQTIKLPTRDGGMQEIEIDTKDILFVFGGAFVGIDAKKEKTVSIGFGSSKTEPEPIDKPITQDDIVKYGFIPEFVGRVPIVVKMNELSRDNLKDILIGTDKSILKQYQHMFMMDKIKASFDDSLINEIIDNSVEKHMGARGLRGTIEKDIMNLMFEVSKYTHLKSINITRELLNNPSQVLSNSESKKEEAIPDKELRCEI